jgi:branched-chain amino acid transport system substrate-binding protein
VGVTVEKSGPFPTLGKALAGVEAAAGYLNANGGIGGKQVELMVRDNAGDPSRAIRDVRDFADRDVGIVLGPVSGTNCRAIAAEAAEAEIVEFCVSGDILPEQDDHMFGVGTDYTNTTHADFELMEQLGDQVATFVTDSQSGDDTARLVEQEAEARGLKVEIERHDASATTLKPQIQEVLANGADTLHLTSCAPVTITAAKEAIDLGFQGKILIENCHVSEASAQAVKDFANDQVLVLAPQFMLGLPADDDPRMNAIGLYRQEVGEPDIVVAAGWDALMMAAKAIEDTGSTDPADILVRLERGFTYTGVWAWNEFDDDEHRGARTEGALIPASITSQGTFEPLPEVG